MANKKNFILLSMEDDKIKKISNVISNDSCRKILDFLANKEATESELSSTLNIPISTVHYNLQQLTEAGLVSADEYHYSQKGKEVNHYKLANRYIIIAPKNTYGIKEKLRSILPAVLIVSGAALVIQFARKFLASGALASQDVVVRSAGIASIESAPEAAPMMAQEAAKTAADQAIQQTTQGAVQEAGTQAVQQASQAMPNIALWFLAGALFALLIYFIISIIRKDVD